MNLVAPWFRLGALPKDDPAVLRLQHDLKHEVGITEGYSNAYSPPSLAWTTSEPCSALTPLSKKPSTPSPRTLNAAKPGKGIFSEATRCSS